jgi:hypothetical protein
VAGVGECTGGERAEAAGSTGDNDNLFHDTYPFVRLVCLPQTMPPLARSV